MEIYIVSSDGIKRRIMQNKNIPLPMQTLYFNGKVLDNDEVFVVYLGIDKYSQIQLQVGGGQQLPRKLSLRIKVPNHDPFVMEVEGGDTIMTLKEMIQERFPNLHANRMAAQVSRFVLQDNLSIEQSGLISNSLVEVFIKPQLPLRTGGRGSGSSLQKKPSGSREKGKLTVRVIPWNSRKKIPLEVNSEDKVTLLKDLLEELQQEEGFELPDEYFFIHKQSVMEEDNSFRQSNVEDGDIIEVFSGGVTGGS